MCRVELSKRAQRDLRRLDARTRASLLRVLEEDLAGDPPAANLDIKPLIGRAPWLRLRRGEYRVIYRALTRHELEPLDAVERHGILVERVVDRRDLERAVSTLQP